MTHDFDTQFEKHKAMSREAFIRKRRYVRFFVFAVLAVFAAISVMAGFYYYQRAPVGQAILITVTLIGLGVVDWFAITLNRRREHPIPEPLLHGISTVLAILLISVIFALA